MLRGIVAQRLVRKLCPQCRRPQEHVPEAVRRFDAAHGETVYFAPKGCAACHGTGFRGRTVIHEILPVTAEIAEAISARTPEHALVALARKAGMATLFEQGLAKAAAGETSVDEILRAVSATG